MRILVAFCFLFLCNCKGKITAPKNAESSYTVMILPLGEIPNSTSTKIYQQLLQHFPKVRLLKKEALPAFAFYASHERYRADSIIKWLQQRAGKNELYVALTNQDISTNKGEIVDYGIMGLAYRPGRACIASYHRLKDKNNFYKVVIHELAHTTGLPHCTNKNCYLRDAKGGDHTSDEKSFCNSCEAMLVKCGWHL